MGVFLTFYIAHKKSSEIKLFQQNQWQQNNKSHSYWELQIKKVIFIITKKQEIRGYFSFISYE